MAPRFGFIGSVINFVDRVIQHVSDAIRGVNSTPPGRAPQRESNLPSDFNINDPSTYSVSRSTFAGSYYYTVRVSPSNPSTYTGPPFYTISSNHILTEEQILELAGGIATSKRGKSQTDQVLELDIVGATINQNLV